jgi:uncharacterized membrane protein YphA (DoxX/SURF4 family)
VRNSVGNLLNNMLPSPFAYVVECFVSVVLGILFIQSGVDKVVDRAGNMEWLKGHFSKTPLAPITPIMVSVLTVMELLAGLLCVVGFLIRASGGSTLIASYGVVLCMATFCALFFGYGIMMMIVVTYLLSCVFFISLQSTGCERLCWCCCTCTVYDILSSGAVCIDNEYLK